MSRLAEKILVQQWFNLPSLLTELLIRSLVAFRSPCRSTTSALISNLSIMPLSCWRKILLLAAYL